MTQEWKEIVKDGYPEKGKDVLVYDHGSIYVAKYTGRMARGRATNGREIEVPIWDDNQGVMGMFDPAPYPTHWMDFPEEPKDGVEIRIAYWADDDEPE